MITGYKQQKRPVQTTDEAKLAEDLNTFYTRFDKRDFHMEQERVMSETQSRSSHPVVVSNEDVRACFRKVNPRSAAGPDKVSGRTLKECSESLAPVFTKLIQMSLDESYIPRIWKTSTIVPVAKKRSAKELNNYRPVALTSIPFKCAEKIVLRLLRSETAGHQDPLQFAYSKDKSTEDAILTLLHRLYDHLDKPKSYARVLFIDFFSAFNTMQPHLLVEKLLAMSVNPVLIHWIFSFLTDRPQQVRVGQALSSLLTTNTGAPQGCVLSPVLFVLYTADCRSKEDGNVMVNFADDTSLSGLIQEDDSSYRQAVEDLIEWCDRNYLELNVTKTKEVVINFRKAKVNMDPIVIRGQPVEIVTNYKYLGTIIDNKLDWSPNIEACCKKANQRMYFLRKLKQFKVDKNILVCFYQTIIQSAMLYNQVCYFGNSGKADTERLDKVARTAAKIVGAETATPSTIYGSVAVKRLHRILSDAHHPLNHVLSSQVSRRASSQRLRCFRARTSRFRDSFLPTAVRLHNSSL